MSWPIRILHLEDNGNDRELVAALLAQSGLECEIVAVETRSEFLQALNEQSWNVILADFALPAFDGYSALNLAHQLAPQIPFIFVSGVIGEDLAVETLKNGATDYVLKNHLERLGPAVQRALTEAAERHRLRETQKGLFTSEERFRLLVQSIRDYAVYMVDPGGLVASWNGGSERIFGYNEREAVGSPVRNLFRHDDAREHCYERLVRTAEEKGRAEQEMWQVRKGGECFWANVILTALPGLHGFAVITQDIGGRQRDLQELENARQERSRMQERFLSHVSHELRTPLTTIVDFASLLTEGVAGPISVDQRQYLEIVLRASNQLAIMVNSLLDLSRTDWRRLAVVQECVHIDKLVGEVCQNFAAGAAAKNIDLRNRASKGLPPAFADPSRITQVLSNLVDNAIKYSPAGSWVEVTAERSPNEADFLCIGVRDNGRGIEAQYQSRIFERFFRISEGTDSHPGGMGLGLYISREIVKAHGGELLLSFSESPGCTFHFTLPVFQLERILAPIVSPKNLAAGTAGLITVTTPEMPNCTSVDLRRYLGSVRETVRRCIHESSDMILPLMDMEGTPALHIVVFTKPGGLPRIASGIREELTATQELQPLEGEFEVTSQNLDISACELDNIPKAVQRIAAEVEAGIGFFAKTGGRYECAAAQSVGD